MSTATDASKTLEHNHIAKFYEGTNVFITGVSGFLGKVLLEKLLRSCDGIRCIYVLMRPKDGAHVEHRLKKLLESSVFGKMKEGNLKSMEKIKPVSGDIGEENLGLSEADRKLLVDEVNVVFHTAATVRFAEDLKVAILLNVLGTKQVVELCKEVKYLKGFVYVSTAYSNPDKTNVEEIVYNSPCDPTARINLAKILPRNLLGKYTKGMIGSHPNTYTFSKAVAESVVLKACSQLPAAIVRPSIVGASWREPFPGWVDNLGGATGVIAGGASGAITYLRIKREINTNVIPVDVVVNTIIAAAWHSSTFRSDQLKVYNCVSNGINEITWGKFVELAQTYSRKYPTQNLVRFPTFKTGTNCIMYGIGNILFNLLPALTFDIALLCTGKKPKMVPFWKKAIKGFENVKFVTFYERSFQTKTMKVLTEAVGGAEDGQNFKIDISNNNGFDWDDYMKTYVLGIRKYIFKENIFDLHLAKAKLNRVYWIERVIQVVCYLMIFWSVINLL